VAEAAQVMQRVVVWAHSVVYTRPRVKDLMRTDFSLFMSLVGDGERADGA
jgi:hypothetical protein